MIIYNITTQVSWEIHDRWLLWIREQQVPLLMKTELFSHYQLVRLLEVDEHEGPTYALQLYVQKDRSIEEFRSDHMQVFSANEIAMWGDHAFSFSSLMEVIN